MLRYRKEVLVCPFIFSARGTSLLTSGLAEADAHVGDISGRDSGDKRDKSEGDFSLVRVTVYISLGGELANHFRKRDDLSKLT